jgi:hypothetical protein
VLSRIVAVAALVLAIGCRQTRCIEPPASCLEMMVDTRDTGGGVTAVRVVSFESTCTLDLRLYCELGAWDAGLTTGTSRNFYFDTRTEGPVMDPLGAAEIYIDTGQTFGLACVSLSPEDAAEIAGCVDASCGDPSAEAVAIDASQELDGCRTGAFFVPITIAP